VAAEKQEGAGEEEEGALDYNLIGMTTYR